MPFSSPSGSMGSYCPGYPTRHLLERSAQTKCDLCWYFFYLWNINVYKNNAINNYKFFNNQ